MLPLSLEIVAIITVLIGIIVNGYILLIVTFTKQIAYVNKLLLLHLGVVNTLICFTYLTFYVMSLLNLLVLVDIACIIFGLSFNIMHSVALWNLCALNFDRYFAIASPLHYGALINTKKVLIGLGCGWIVSILFALPQLLQVSPFYYDTFYEICLPNYKTAGSLVYNTSLTAFTIFLPIILIFGCNMKVLMIARYQRHRIASAILEVTLSAQLTITHQRNPFFIPSFTSAVQNPTALKIHTHHSPVSSIFQLVGSIIFIYCPYYFCNLWNNVIEAVRTEEKNNVETDLLIPKIVLQISASLLLLSPFVNALLYGIKNKIIRKSFHNFWRKQKSKIEIHYEIQARTPSTCGSRRPSINGTNSAQPLLHRQLSETFLEISKADINNIQSDIKLRSESLWSSNSKLSSYSVLNSPIGNQTTSNLTPGPTISTNEPKFVYLNPSSSPPPPPPPAAHALEHPAVPSTSGSSKISYNIRSTVRHYSTKPKIKITKTFSEEKQSSPVHGINHPLDDTAVKIPPKNTKSLFNLGQPDDNLTVDAKDPEPTLVRHSKTRTINISPFKKYSSLQEISITSTTATVCDILK